jgi:hypothetical protein
LKKWKKCANRYISMRWIDWCIIYFEKKLDFFTWKNHFKVLIDTRIFKHKRRIKSRELAVVFLNFFKVVFKVEVNPSEFKI